MVSSVWDVTFDRPPGRAALKVSDEREAFRGERAGLDALRQAGFPVPGVCFLLGPDGNGLPGRSVLGLEWMDGEPLGHVTLSPAEREDLDARIGEAVSALHTHTRPRYGSLEGEPAADRWVDIFRDRLEDMLEHRPQFMNRAWGIDLDTFFTLTRKLRASLPDEVRQARKVHSDQERIIGDARHEAARIVEDARNQAGLLVTQSEVTRLASERAQSIIAQAEQDCARIRAEAEVYSREMRRSAEDYSRTMRRDADDYATELLESLHAFATKVVRTIEKGQERLEEQQHVATGDEKEEQ
jgi:vacuolar-type H+-ATPase subunit H